MAQQILSRFKLSMPGYFFCASMLSVIALGTLAIVADPAGPSGGILNLVQTPDLTPIITLFVE